MTKVILLILDGWGCGKNSSNNAIFLANTPNFDRFASSYQFCQLRADSEYVGIPNGSFGNSEIGHMTMGSGRVFDSSLLLINEFLENNNLEKNTKFTAFINKIIKNNGSCHIIGLASDGGVHSHINHIIKVSNKVKSLKCKVHIHAITDGRDVDEKSSIKYLEMIDDISTISGRYYAMDRDNNKDRIEKFIYTITKKGKLRHFDAWKDYINVSYENGIYDEHIYPAAIKEYDGIKENDGIIIMNYRKDRALQIVNELNNFNNQNKKIIPILGIIDMGICESLIVKKDIDNVTCLGEILSQNLYKQLRLSETEKYHHVTDFFDLFKHKNIDNIDNKMITSKKCSSYTEIPEMCCYEITEYLINNAKNYNFSVVNYPNADILGHTGNINATIESIEQLDICLGKIEHFCLKNNITLIITADHGNADIMLNEKDNTLCKTHTINPVPFILINSKKIVSNKLNMGLANIAGSILQIFDIAAPKEIKPGFLE